MKKTSFSLVSKILIVIVLASNLTGLGVFANEKEGVNIEQTRTRTSADDSGVVFNKINARLKEGKSILLNSSIPQKGNLSESKKKLGTNLLRLIDSSFLLPNQNRNQVVFQMKSLKQFATKTDSVKTIDKRVANKTHNDLVYVYVSLTPTASTSIINSIAWNVTDRDEKNHLAVALVEVDKLETLASLKGVKSVSSVLPPVTRSGSVVTEGDIIHQTDDVRSAYSQSGAGMKIGVISDGVDNLASAQTSGDLPAAVTVLSNSEGGDEGTAMLEIIYDMVPNASLYFHDSGSNKVAFNSAIDDLVAAGVNVIVDDIGWITEPFFEDGTIASHVASVLAANNIVYISAAGNDAKKHYQGDYFNDGFDYHDFSRNSSTNDYLYLDIPNNAEVTVVLQWNDSFGSSGNDYDLILFNTDGWGILDESVGSQDGTGDPIEAFSYTNTTGSAITAEIDVGNFDGLAATKTLELFIYPSNGTSLYTNNITPVDSIFGHSAVPGAIAVGAIAANDPGNDTIESFSSQGPVTINGQTQRAKPDVTGIDRVVITGAGGFPNPFSGTSAAAPHIAAIVAQLWGQYPSATSTQIKNYILNSAVDLGIAGTDTIFGHGRADSLFAFQAATPTNPATVNLGTAGNFAILAKTAITTTGSTAITGNLGISPAAASSMTGFGPVLDSSGTFSTSSLVTGRIYAADYTSPTPSSLTTAVSAMEAAYTSATERVVDVTNPGAIACAGTCRDLAGLTLLRGVYSFSGPDNVIISGDVTLSGGADDVWIFKIQGTLDISANKKVLLSGGAQAKNVFWVVAGATTLVTGSTFEGNILAQTNIAMQAGAILHGSALAQTAVTLIASTVIISAPATHTISGTIKYYDGVKVVPNATVTLEDALGTQVATTTTDANGFYQFVGVDSGGDYVIRISKSDNASGLSSNDQIKIGRHIVGLEIFSTIYKNIAGDVNNSGGLTSNDQIKIGRFIVGLDSNLPSGAWKFYASGTTLTTANYLTVGLTRAFTNLTVDTPSQDFVGIKMGDVNNSWINN
ncbi:MAG: ice-binding family protein [bacterium]|nr:ice-binding family protein [bacterium]